MTPGSCEAAAAIAHPIVSIIAVKVQLSGFCAAHKDEKAQSDAAYSVTGRRRCLWRPIWHRDVGLIYRA